MKTIQEILTTGNEKMDMKFYQTYLDDLYLDVNDKRDFSDIYGNLHRNIGYLGKSIELNKKNPDNFIFAISWLIALSNILNINIIEALVSKFPRRCPYCQEQICVCYRTNKKPITPISDKEIEKEVFFIMQEVKKGISVFNLDKSVELISHIYPSNEVIWIKAGYHSHLLKIHQELTEIHEAYWKFEKNKENTELIKPVMDEVADVFAWILSAWAIYFPEESMDKAFINHYFNGCPVCKSAPCKCEIADSPPATLPDFRALEQVEKNLEEINNILPDSDNKIKNLLASFSDVLKDQRLPSTLKTLRNTRETLEELRRKITTLDTEGKCEYLLYSSLETVNGILIDEGNKNHSYNRYKVFLSYSIKNQEEARKISEFLEKNGKKVFMSQKSIKPGEVWEETIKDALRNSDYFCLLASIDSLQSEWVKKEMDSIWALEIKPIPILLRCDPRNLPDIIKKYQCIDFGNYKELLDVIL